CDITPLDGRGTDEIEPAVHVAGKVTDGARNFVFKENVLRGTPAVTAVGSGIEDGRNRLEGAGWVRGGAEPISIRPNSTASVQEDGPPTRGAGVMLGAMMPGETTVQDLFGIRQVEIVDNEIMAMPAGGIATVAGRFLGSAENQETIVEDVTIANNRIQE